MFKTEICKNYPFKDKIIKRNKIKEEKHLAFGNWTGSPGHKCNIQTNTPRTLSHHDFGAQNLETCELILTQISQSTFIIKKCQKNIYLKKTHKFHNLLLSSKNDKNNIYFKKNKWKFHVFYVLHAMAESYCGCLDMQRALRLKTNFNILGLEMTTKKLIHNFLKIKIIIIIIKITEVKKQSNNCKQ